MLGKPHRGGPRPKKRWQLELEGELAGDSDEAPHRRLDRSRSRSPLEKAKEESEQRDSQAESPLKLEEHPKESKAYAWMDSGDEGPGSDSEGATARSRSRSPEVPAVAPGDVETLSQMMRLAEAFGKRKVQELAELPAELGAVCAAAARVKYYDSGLFTETLGPALRKCFQAGLDSSGAEADSRRFSLMEALDVLRALSQLNAAKALSAVFKAAIKAIEAHVKRTGTGGSLEKEQIKFLRETFAAAGREEDVAFLAELRGSIAGPQGSVKEGLNSQGLPMRPGARICDSFAKSGTCRLATNCRFDHPEGMKVTFNSEGFPMRPWAATCPYYMSMGTCDFKRNCKWHHPDKRERCK